MNPLTLSTVSNKGRWCVEIRLNGFVKASGCGDEGMKQASRRQSTTPREETSSFVHDFCQMGEAKLGIAIVTIATSRRSASCSELLSYVHAGSGY